MRARGSVEVVPCGGDRLSGGERRSIVEVVRGGVVRRDGSLVSGFVAARPGSSVEVVRAGWENGGRGYMVAVRGGKVVEAVRGPECGVDAVVAALVSVRFVPETLDQE